MKRTALSIIALFALLIGVSIAEALTSSAESQGPQGPPIQDPNPGRRLRALSLTKTSVIGGTNFSGRVILQFVAPNGGTRVNFTTDPPFNPEGGNAAFVPSGVTVPQGEANATFQINTFPVQLTRQVTIQATAGGVTKTASFAVEPVRVAGFVITPTFGVGPFQARATVILNADAVSDTDVTLTSSNPDVVGFGPGGLQTSRIVRFQQGQRALTNIQLGARSVQQTTAVTINATLNGATQSRTVTVRPQP